MKLGWFNAVDKRNDCKDCKGFRNTFNVTPTYHGVPQGPETGCGAAFIKKYGEFDRFQTSPLWDGRQGVEVQSDNAYLLVEATNSDGDPTHWSGKTYLYTGARTFCVSWPHLPTYRCQDGNMDSTGRLVGFGEDNRGYDLPK